jgi:hypothetical protein
MDVYLDASIPSGSQELHVENTEVKEKYGIYYKTRDQTV